jgi:hypothetical protein
MSAKKRRGYLQIFAFVMDDWEVSDEGACVGQAALRILPGDQAQGRDPGDL